MKLNTDHYLTGKPPKCPNCEEDQDGAMGGPLPPESGDYCICAYCGTVSRYTIIKNNYYLSEATKEDFDIAKANGILDGILAMQSIIKLKNKSNNEPDF